MIRETLLKRMGVKSCEKKCCELCVCMRGGEEGVGVGRVKEEW